IPGEGEARDPGSSSAYSSKRSRIIRYANFRDDREWRLSNHVRQQPEKTRALDRGCELALFDRGYGRDARRHDLAALRDVTLQELHVLVVDLRRAFARERAGLA